MPEHEPYLMEGERVDDLMNGRRVIQHPDRFCFGMDAVLLAHFPTLKKRDIVMDLCTGSGVIPFILSAEAEVPVTGLELQPAMAEMAARSVLLNGLAEQIRIVEGDLRNIRGLFGAMTFSLVTCNPPYMSGGHGKVNTPETVAAARHEICATLEDVAGAASYLLKNNGRFAMVHRPQRLPELMETLRKHHLEPKRMRMVHPYRNKEANLVLIEAVKCGKAYLRTEPPLIIYESPGIYTNEVLGIYGMHAE